MRRQAGFAGALLAAGALGCAATLIAKNEVAPAPASPPSFAATTVSGPLPDIPPAPAQRPTLLKPYVGDKDSIIERYRPAFHAMGYEIGMERSGVVGDKILYHWWAQRRFEQKALLPPIGEAGFRANPYGQPESEEAVKKLLAEVKRTEGRQ